MLMRVLGLMKALCWKRALCLLLWSMMSSVAIADPQATLTASRLSGPAPLAVFFDATGTLDSSGQANTFREYLYTFDFGNRDAGLWLHTGSRKNVQAGAPLAAHVYDTPGEYEVTLEVSDAHGKSDSVRLMITVVPTDEYYAGGKTVVLSMSDYLETVPLGAEVITNVTAWPSWKSDTRYILTGGQDYRPLGDLYIKQVSNWQIVGSNENDKPVLNRFRVEAGNPTGIDWAKNGVIMNLNLNTADRKKGHSVLDIGNSTVGVLAYKNTLNGQALNGGRLEHSYSTSRSQRVKDNLHWPKHFFFVENEMELNKKFGVGYYGYGTEVAVMGNSIANPTQHCIRTPLAHKTFVAHNRLLGAGSSKHHVKIHSRGLDSFNIYLKDSTTPRSRFVAVTDNIVGSLDDINVWPIALTPQNSEKAEGIEDGVVEYNIFGKSFSQEVSLGGRRLAERRNCIVGGGTVVANGSVHSRALPAEWDGPYYLHDNRGAPLLRLYSSSPRFFPTCPIRFSAP